MKPPIFQNRTIATVDGEIILYTSEEVARLKLQSAWQPRLRQFHTPPQPTKAPGGEHVRYYSSQLEPQPERPDRWLFGLGQQFLKAVDSIDRKMQGQILQAMTAIAKAPLTNRGDTVKPLMGEMNGYWRYRIGNFRLVYYPDEATRTITFYDFASRGSVYD
jgi:mRNA interferase RelE/StbE